jgi:acetolactate synthase
MTTGFSINSAGSGQAEEKAPAAERMTGSQAIIRTLELLGVTDVFGLPGAQFCPPTTP